MSQPQEKGYSQSIALGIIFLQNLGALKSRGIVELGIQAIETVEGIQFKSFSGVNN